MATSLPHVGMRGTRMWDYIPKPKNPWSVHTHTDSQQPRLCYKLLIE